MSPKQTVTQKINEVYQIHIHNSNELLPKQPYPVSRATLLKYIKLKELLDEDVFLHLDKKGSEKITMGLALKICDLVLNPLHQKIVLPEILSMSRSLAMTSGIRESTTCLICAETSPYFESTPCCKNLICGSCFFKVMETPLLDFTFTGVRCPFCREHIPMVYMRWFLKRRYREIQNISWRQTKRYSQQLNMEIYAWNLYRKYEFMIRAFEETLNILIHNIDYDNFSFLDKDHVYGHCSVCTQGVSENIRQRRDFLHIKMIGIEKQCANDENEVLVLRPDMFLCTICKSFQEDYSDGTFKQCPHCGVKTVKPEGCNYVCCGDHRWCFICNERLENNENGHNVHFHTGPGTSPYSDQCRKSVNSEKDTFILSTCECSACAPHGGQALCATLECMNRTHTQYCDTCDTCDTCDPS